MNHSIGSVLGQRVLDRGILEDSRGFPIDPGALYEYESTGATVTAIWRAGLTKPAMPTPLKRAPRVAKHSGV